MRMRTGLVRWATVVVCRGWGVVGVAAGAGLVAVGCTTNPTTGRSQLAVLSREDEIQLGSEAAPQMAGEFGGEVPDAEVQAYVREVGRKLSGVTEADNPSLPWEFTLLNSDVINAFALPGGKVFITRGLAEKMGNEAQLAGVLGHEVGHVTARHTSERIAQSGLAQLVIAGAAIGVGATTDSEVVRAGAPVAIGLGGQLVVLKFSRDQESEADSLGMRYMTRLGYDAQGQLQMMQVLQRASEGGRQLELLATHPYPETRIERIRYELQTTYANQKGEFGEAAYRDRMLARLAKLPRPTKQEEKAVGMLLERAEHALFPLAARAGACGEANGCAQAP